MEDVRPLLNFYKSSLSNTFNKITKPLQMLSLDGFWFSFIHPDGYFYQVGNRPDVGEVYFSNHLYIHNPFICNPTNYSHNQAILTSDFPYPKFHEVQKMVDYSCGFKDFLFLYKKIEQFTFCLHFSSSQKNLSVNTIILNNFFQLNNFADHFIEEWKPLLKKMDAYTINVSQDIPMFFKKNSLFETHASKKEDTLKFLSKLGLYNEHLFESITSREIDIIQELVQGKTARQIGLALDISSRTIEHHMENLKSKLDCSSKQELLIKLNKFSCSHI